MYKVIKSTETETGNLSIQQQNFMNNLNRTPEFDEGDKSWHLKKVLHTDTPCTPWLIQVEEEFFVAVQAPPAPRGSHQVSFYPSNEKGKYKVNLRTMVDRLPLYVDLESACDEFARKHFAAKIATPTVED